MIEIIKFEVIRVYLKTKNWVNYDNRIQTGFFNGSIKYNTLTLIHTQYVTEEFCNHFLIFAHHVIANALHTGIWMHDT